MLRLCERLTKCKLHRCPLIPTLLPGGEGLRTSLPGGRAKRGEAKAGRGEGAGGQSQSSVILWEALRIPFTWRRRRPISKRAPLWHQHQLMIASAIASQSEEHPCLMSSRFIARRRHGSHNDARRKLMTPGSRSCAAAPLRFSGCAV